MHVSLVTYGEVIISEREKKKIVLELQSLL